MRDLYKGDHGTDVVFAQNLLNSWMIQWKSKTELTPDGDFGDKTKAAVMEFQKGYAARFPSSGLPATGAIGPRTWSALGANNGISHSVKMVPQYNGNTCWEACMNMILGGKMCRDMPAAMLSSDPATRRQLLDQPHVIRDYAAMLGRNYSSAPHTVRALGAMIERRPAVLLGKSTRYPDNGHAVVISGLWTEKTVNEALAVLRIHNPSPVNRGRVEATQYPYMEIEGASFTPKYVLW